MVSSKKNSYQNPALIEAVFELRFPANPRWGMGSVVKFANLASAEGYPEVVDSADGFQINFTTNKNKPEFRPVSRRIQTWNKEGNELWQASAELFAANRRAPYAGWNEFRPHILKGFQLYQNLAKHKKANHLSLQYVNRIEFDKQDTAGSFLIFMPPEISYADVINAQTCNSQQTFKDGDTITVTAGLNLMDGEKPAMILNLTYTSPSPPLKMEELMKKIDIAHRRIIDAFEKSITDKQRERMVKV
ncbi:MAG: TIGR04255 family protein [Chloracidobacterium sp.]|nr:TIGR04255 family protein [Chloracidobacterium sp.]